MNDAPWSFNKDFCRPEEPWNKTDIICLLSVILGIQLAILVIPGQMNPGQLTSGQL